MTKWYVVMCGPPGSGKTSLAEYIKKVCTDKHVVYIDQDMFNGNLVKFTNAITRLFSDPSVQVVINGKTNINIKARSVIPMPPRRGWKVLGVNLAGGNVLELLDRIINRKTMSTVTPEVYSEEDIKKIIVNFLHKYQIITTKEKRFHTVLNLDFDTPVLLKAIQVCKVLH